MSGCRIFIGRLSPSAREKDVERFFKGYGRIRDIDLKRGFGFVVVVSSLPPCSLSLLRWGAEMGRSRRQHMCPLCRENGALGARCCPVDEDGDNLCSLKEG
ncbi:hypothetical protein XENOCAPTIV_007075 [Xenoophorus captivus]|uniref:RRM domain-containing protein n=1 Tax=Xenoophorus captivus TaxID=1517983 RepID=A0ABV0RP65_9TELE